MASVTNLIDSISRVHGECSDLHTCLRRCSHEAINAVGVNILSRDLERMAKALCECTNKIYETRRKLT